MIHNLGLSGNSLVRYEGRRIIRVELGIRFSCRVVNSKVSLGGCGYGSLIRIARVHKRVGRCSFGPSECLVKGKGPLG